MFVTVLQIPEGFEYADEQINVNLDELKALWQIKDILKNK